MKNSVLVLFCCLLFCCNCSKVNSPQPIDNGIDQRLLNFIDSLSSSTENPNFAYITFHTDSLGRPIIIVIKQGLLIPAPPEPPTPYREILISETESFVGYKKYKDLYIVFLSLRLNLNKQLSPFVNIDSLLRDEKPFIENNIYDMRFTKSGDKPIEKIVLLVAKNDSLIRLNKNDIMKMFGDINL